MRLLNKAPGDILKDTAKMLSGQQKMQEFNWTKPITLKVVKGHAPKLEE